MRPVHLAFEIDRFRVVHAIDILKDEINKAPPELQRLPWTKPTWLSVPEFTNEKEGFEATMASINGLPLGAKPELWQSYEKARLQILNVAKPVSDLKQRFPAQANMIDAAMTSALGGNAPNRAVGYVPLVGRDKFWTVLLDLNSIEVIAFVPIDSF